MWNLVDEGDDPQDVLLAVQDGHAQQGPAHHVVCNVLQLFINFL